jgi:hypothetical protein
MVLVEGCGPYPDFQFRRFQLLRLRTKANPTRAAPKQIPIFPTLENRNEVPNRFMTVPPVGSGYMSQIPPPIAASPIKSVSHSTVSLSDAEPGRLIAELRTDRPGLPLIDRLLSSALSRQSLSILCRYEADLSTRQLQEIH